MRDYRHGQIAKMTNVNVYRDSALTADDVLGFGFEHVAIATGARWRRDGIARYNLLPIPLADGHADLHAGRPDGGLAALGRGGGL